MILIAHRGNLTGPNPELENDPSYITQALDKGYHAEVDVWLIEDQFYLGHDVPQYKIKDTSLNQRRLWCHAKNLPALQQMLQIKVHCFWHQEDDFTLTSKGIIWTYPNKDLTPNSICVSSNLQTYPPDECLGICSDYVDVIK